MIEIFTHKLNLGDCNKEIVDAQIVSYNTTNILYSFILKDESIILQKVHYNSQIEKHIIFEIINDCKLWSMKKEFEINNNNFLRNKIVIRYLLDLTLFDTYKLKSFALNLYLATKAELLQSFTKFNDKLSFLPELEPYEPSNLCKVKLYDYQKRSLNKMIQIENSNLDLKVNYLTEIKINDIGVMYNPIMNNVAFEPKYFSIKTKGGILADEMGLGKTITTLSLILSNTSKETENFKQSKKDNYSKLFSKATLIVCPSHLTKQWESESLKLNPLFKIITILTKKDHEKLLFKHLIDVDIIITSHQFLMNFKYYPSLYVGNTTASSYSAVRRNTILRQHFIEKIEKLLYKDIKEKDCPLFEFFYFERLVLDEGHEIFGDMLGNSALSKYMTSWLSSIDANYNWYVSGSPFVNYHGLMNCLSFIGVKMIETTTKVPIDFTNTSDLSNMNTLINKDFFWNSVLSKICIRHKKSDIIEKIDIMGYEEIIEWVTFTSLERNIYDSKKNKISTDDLIKLCCHPLVLESSKRVFGDVELDLDAMQAKLVEYHNNQITTYEAKLKNVAVGNQHNIVRTNYQTYINESRFMLRILETINSDTLENDEEKTCLICFEVTDLTLTKCGHLFCRLCIKEWLNRNNSCPMCKKLITLGDVFALTKNVNNNIDDINPLIKKYGSKLGKIISMIRSLTSDPESRIIIFSQWDTMLSLISKTLSENGIANCTVKGNVWSRTSAINKFKQGKTLSGEENKVILLSLKNSASGTNLTEATHIFFVEPINDEISVIKAIEGQAIARACRIGQKKKIKLYRTLIKDSIDETIYNKNYCV
jgi:DNA repair protein RAD5